MSNNHLIENSKNEITRNSPEYNKYKKKVKLRDSFCQCCGGDENLEVHHPFSYKEYVDLRADIKNGVVLCKKCHKEYHKRYGRKKNNNPVTFAQFLRDNSTIKNTRISLDNLLNDEKILKRDKKCMHVKCGSIYELEVHHDKNIKDGGITLCKKCHSDYHERYGYEEFCNILTLEDFLIPNGQIAYDIIIRKRYDDIIYDEDTKKSYYVTYDHGNVEEEYTEHGRFLGDSYWPGPFSRITLGNILNYCRERKFSIKELKSRLVCEDGWGNSKMSDKEFNNFIKDLKRIGIIIESEEEGYYEVKS